jgi:hypothetical protein
VPHHPFAAAPKAHRHRFASPQRPTSVRPLDDGATELARVIQFLWTKGRRIQPVLMVERELLN